MIKPAYSQPIDQQTRDEAITLFEDNLRILHPFMPFITEELWHQISDRVGSQALIVSEWPKTKEIDQKVIKEFDFVQNVITGIRNIRKEKNIAFKNAIDLHILNNENANDAYNILIQKMGNIECLDYVDSQVEGCLSFRVKANEYFIPVAGSIDVEAEKEKLNEELKYLKGFLVSVDKKLSNTRFVNNAPEKVVNIEKQKKADAEAKIQTINKSLENL